jgi:FIMAH domain
VVTLSVSANDPVSGVAPGNTTVVLDGANRTVGEAVKLWTLPLGTHAVSASASDVAGNTSQQARTFRVIATIGSVAALVNMLGDQGQIEDGARRTLLVKLGEAQQLLDRNRRGDAKSQLQDVIDYCMDQRGKKVGAEACDLLVTDLKYVRGTM